MAKKKITLTWKNQRFSITVEGDKCLISQISNKPKKITFYCCGSELDTEDHFLFEKIREKIENQDFSLDHGTFAADRVNTFFILTNAFFVTHTFNLILHDSEIRILLFWNRTDAEDVDDTFIASNTRRYRCEAKKFKLLTA